MTNPSSLQTIDFGNWLSTHNLGIPGVGLNKCSNSNSFNPPSLSLSNLINKSTKNLYPVGDNSTLEFGLISTFGFKNYHLMIKNLYN